MAFEYNAGGRTISIKSKFFRVLVLVLFILFFIGIVFSIIVDGLYRNDINDYSNTHEELKTYAPISNVAYEKDTELIYVFYKESNAVNVYNYSGNFEWSVSIPKQQNGEASFYLENGMFYLIWYDTYIYNAESGAFIDKHESTDEECAKSKSFEEANNLKNTDIDFNVVDVFVKNKDNGIVRYIVDRPEYYALINPFVGWAVGFISALLIAVITIIKVIVQKSLDK